MRLGYIYSGSSLNFSVGNLEILNMYNPSSVKQLKYFIAASANQSLEYSELETPSQLVSISCSTLHENSELYLTSASMGYKQLGAPRGGVHR